MITVKLLYICLTLSAILCPEMVSTQFTQDNMLLSSCTKRSRNRGKRQVSTCITPDDEIGDCMNIKQCPPLLNMLRSQGKAAHAYIRERTCSYDGTKAIVCCVNDNAKGRNSNPQDPLLRPPHCGLSVGSQDKVVGGTRAKLGAWPWIAVLGYRNETNPWQLDWQCGGTLISARHVLTAAHCVNNNYLSAVRIGDLNLKRSDDGAHPVQVGVAQKIIHPQYRVGSAENDIAVIKLAEDVPISKSMNPICLPVDEPLRSRNYDNSPSYIAGWGSQSLEGRTVDHLMEAQLPVISNDICRQQYSNVRGAVIDNRVMCAGYADGGKDACQGDSGGPLMVPHTLFVYQIGVISYSYNCAEPGYAGVYTRVTEFLDFIISAVQ